MWYQSSGGGTGKNIQVLSNILVSANPSWSSGPGNPDQLLRYDAALLGEEWDYNAYWPDGTFELGQFTTSTSFSVAQDNASMPNGYGSGALFETAGRLLTAQPFNAGIAMFGADWTTMVVGFDPTLSAGSNAIGGGIGTGAYEVDQGAVQDGDALPTWGNRNAAAAATTAVVAAGVTMAGVK